jgi:hypothetical protein
LHPGLSIFTIYSTGHVLRMLTECNRRKYFSTIERLRIAHGAATASDGHHRDTSIMRRPSTSAGTRPSHSRSESRMAGSTHTRNVLRRRPSEPGDTSLNHMEAQWFMALPEKVRRQHFSSEEQNILRRQCQTVMENAASGATFRGSKAHAILGTREGAISTPPVFSGGRNSDSVSSSPEPERRSSEPNTSAENHLRHSHRPSAKWNFGTSAGPSNPSGFAPAIVPASMPSHSRKASATLETPAAFYRDEDTRKKLRLYLASPQKFDEAVEFGFPSSTPPIEEGGELMGTSSEPLRLDSRILNNDLHRFLSSTQNTPDFLDLSDGSSINSSLDDSDNGLDDLIDEYHDPLAADTSSLSDLDDPTTPYASGGEEETFEMVGPTPGHYLPSKKPSLASLKATSSHSATPTPSRKQSIRESQMKPLPPHPPVGRRPARKPSVVSGSTMKDPLLANRDMTLRLTLTRPELRAADEDIYGWQDELELDDDKVHTQNVGAGAVSTPPCSVKKGKPLSGLPEADPLALDELPPLVEDVTGEKGAFGVKKRGTVKVWKLMGGK